MFRWEGRGFECFWVDSRELWRAPGCAVDDVLMVVECFLSRERRAAIGVLMLILGEDGEWEDVLSGCICRESIWIVNVCLQRVGVCW